MTFSVREVTLGEVCEIKQGRYLAPNQLEPTPTAECPVPVIGGNGVLGFTNQSTFPFPVPLVTCRGSRCGLMQWAEPPTWISNNAMALYFKENQGDNFFLHQYLLNSSFDDVTTGSAQPQITVTNLSLKQILLPDLQTQKSISSLMKNIEGKISTNTALSKTLEDIAQTIFKSWFIDFDPVKAKMAGEKPAGMDAVTSALFPDSMEESELGLIPKGWNLGILDDVIEIYDSKRIPLAGAERKKRPGKYPYYGATGALDFIDDFLFDGPHLLVGEDGTVITDSGTPLVQYVWNKFWVSNHAHVLKARNGFTVEQLKLLIERIQISNYITGAVQPKLNQGNLKSIPCVIPTATVSGAFGRIIEPIFEQIRRLTDENKILVELRDSLLPRLISGELQIPEEMLAS
jgi:type I restriction enzyme S subunit